MGLSYTFYANNKYDWKQCKKALGKFCIHTNFKKYYKINTKIGEGSFSIVYDAYKLKNFKKVAIKSVNKNQLYDQKKFSVRNLILIVCIFK